MPSPLPKYAFTQIGVGGVVVNGHGEVLMVQEKVSPLPIYQGTWKLPGGLADPGEDFAQTVRLNRLLRARGLSTAAHRSSFIIIARGGSRRQLTVHHSSSSHAGALDG